MKKHTFLLLYNNINAIAISLSFDTLSTDSDYRLYAMFHYLLQF